MDDIKFIFLEINPDLIDAWKRAFTDHNLPLDNFSIVQSNLQDLPNNLRRFDCIVSPANSYGRLDGGFDYFLSEALAPSDDFDALTRVTQKVLYTKWKGYAPPGTCTLIPLENTPCYPNTHSCRFMALCPTMRVPGNVNWNREVVYNCVWSLLNVLSQHNSRSISGISDNDSNKRAEEAKIKSVLITGLATGVGGISAEKCAKQMAMAFADFNDASLNEEKWSSFNWDTALNYANACRDTYDLNAEHGDD